MPEPLDYQTPARPAPRASIPLRHGYYLALTANLLGAFASIGYLSSAAHGIGVAELWGARLWLPLIFLQTFGGSLPAWVYVERNSHQIGRGARWTLLGVSILWPIPMLVGLARLHGPF